MPNIDPTFVELTRDNIHKFLLIKADHLTQLYKDRRNANIFSKANRFIR